jgi:uncharacterized protein (TIGR03435 family)
LTEAYGLKKVQIDGPAWLPTSWFEILAKVPPGATREEFNLMVQNLLEDRFSLKFHHQTRDLPMYEMVVAKGGFKLKESTNVRIINGKVFSLMFLTAGKGGTVLVIDRIDKLPTEN